MNGEYQRFVNVVIELGREQLRGQLDGSKQWDSKALGVLTADGALGSFVVVNHGGLGQGWWVAMVFLGCGAVACLATLFGRTYDLGPDVRSAHDRYGGLGDAAMPALVAELGGTVAYNATVANRREFSFRFAIGLSAAALATVGISVWALR